MESGEQALSSARSPLSHPGDAGSLAGIQPLAASVKSVKVPVWLFHLLSMANPSNDPLHGITLEHMLTELVERHGWERLGEVINIRCFQIDPSIKSSLTFLRRTPWARAEVEAFYLRQLR